MSHSNYVETELKLYVPDLKSVSERLKVLGADLTQHRVFERNVRYENAERTFTERGIVLRLRQDQGVRLTYKEPSSVQSERIATRFEAEVTVSDYDTMALILLRLGYHPHLIYEKYRTTFNFLGAEVVLDEMPYGNFIEIEGTEKVIFEVVAKLGIQDAPQFTASYIQLFDNVRLNLKMDIPDLTFANFQNIKIPFAAFNSPE